MRKSCGVVHCAVLLEWVLGMFSLPCYGIIFYNLYLGKTWKAPKNSGVDHKKYICECVWMYISQYMIIFTHSKNS